MVVECRDCIKRETIDGRPCVFPFITIENKKYNDCTSDLDPDGKLWCATETDELNRLVIGKFGFCSDKCLEKSLCSTGYRQCSFPTNSKMKFHQCVREDMLR